MDAIEVVDEVGLAGGDRQVVELVNAVLHAENAEGALVVALVDEPTITQLNREYRSLEEPTDVLSFRRADEVGNWPGTPDELGEVIVCPAVVARYAAEGGRPWNLQLGWTLIHGVLHVLGYDHECDQGEMRQREQALLESLAPLVAALPVLAQTGAS